MFFAPIILASLRSQFCRIEISLSERKGYLGVATTRTVCRIIVELGLMLYGLICDTDYHYYISVSQKCQDFLHVIL